LSPVYPSTSAGPLAAARERNSGKSEDGNSNDLPEVLHVLPPSSPVSVRHHTRRTASRHIYPPISFPIRPPTAFHQRHFPTPPQLKSIRPSLPLSFPTSCFVVHIRFAVHICFLGPHQKRVQALHCTTPISGLDHGPRLVHRSPRRVHCSPRRVHCSPRRVHCRPSRVHCRPRRVEHLVVGGILLGDGHRKIRGGGMSRGDRGKTTAGCSPSFRVAGSGALEWDAGG